MNRINNYNGAFTKAVKCRGGYYKQMINNIKELNNSRIYI